MQNKDFEQWQNGMPENWGKANDHPAVYPLTIQQETSTKQTGTYSAKVTANQTHQGIEQPITSDMLGQKINVPVYVSNGFASLQLVRPGGIVTDGKRSPFLEDPIVLQAKTAESPLNRTPVIFKCPISKDLVVVWIYGNNINGEMGLDRINMFRRGDQTGTNWSAPAEFGFAGNLPDGFQQYFIGGAYVDEVANKITVVVTCHNNDPFTRRVYTSYSTDDGFTWSPLVKMIPDAQLTGKYCSIFNPKGTVIKTINGTLIASMTIRDATNWQNYPSPTWLNTWTKGGIARSTDNGTTWQLIDIGYLPNYNSYNGPHKTWYGNNGEPAFIQLDNGNILGYTRTSVGHFYYSVSSDNGATWTPWALTDWATPEVNCVFHRMSNGKIFFALNNYAVDTQTDMMNPRARLTGFLADGNFSTFNNPMLIDQEYVRAYTPDTLAGNPQMDNVSYPEIVELDDGNLLMVYDHHTEDSHPRDGNQYWFMELRMIKTKAGWDGVPTDKTLTSATEVNQWVTLSREIPSDTPEGTLLRVASVRDRQAQFFVDNVTIETNTPEAVSASAPLVTVVATAIPASVPKLKGNLWLGQAGSETLLSIMGRKLAVEDFEITKEGRMADGSLVWDVIATKKRFTLSYSTVTGEVLDALASLYSTGINSPLSFKAENEDSTISTYTVKFRPFSRARLLLTGGWLWENISVVLEEV